MSDVLLDEEGNEVKEVIPETSQEDRDDEIHDDDSQDDRPTDSADSDDSDDGAEDEDDREAIRARRREERKNRKIAQKEREESLRRELASRDAAINELRSKLDVIERRNSGTELAQLENAKKQAGDAYNYYKNQIALASEAGNHKLVADATDKMLQAGRKYDELENVEKAFKQRQATPPPLDPRVTSYTQSWASRNSWFDPHGKDADSRVTLALDNQLAEEGWDPTTPQYWQELDSRVKKYLPHRSKSVKNTSEKPKSVVAGSARETSASANAKGTYKLSADRVQALKDAGIWDDPKARADAVKRYREYDKQQGNG